MRLPVTGNFAALDRSTATQRFSDRRNLAVLYFCAITLLIEALVALATSGRGSRVSWMASAAGMTLLAILLFRVCTKLRRPPSDWKPRGAGERALLERIDRNLRSFVISAFLLVAAIVTVRWMFRPDDHPLVILILIAIGLRITFSERLMIHLAILLAAIAVMTFREKVTTGGTVAGYVVLTAFALLVGWLLTRGFVRAFLRAWAPEQQRLMEENRMREELDLARTIQLSMLPRGVPQVDGVSLDARSVPATEVGGDFYDFFVRGGRFGIVAADVAGHGVASGIVLSGVRTALRLLSEDLEQPERMMTRLEELVRETRTERMLVTLCLLSISEDRRSATVISAGHPPVLHWRAATNQVDVVMLPSLPLGTSLAQPCRSAQLLLGRGDRLLIHSDGAYETRNAAGEEFGLERLGEILAAGGVDESPGETLARIVTALSVFRGGAMQEDDITLITVRLD